MTCSALVASVPWRLDPGNGQARDWLDRELSDPVYRDTRDPLQRALDAVLKWLGDLLSGAQGPVGSVPSWVAGLVTVALVALLALALRHVRRSGRRRTGEPAPVLGTERLTADEYRARARTALADGRYAACVLDAMRAIARGAVERTLLEDAPSLTAHEIAQRLGGVFPDHDGSLRQAADWFDAVAYGDGEADRERAAAMLGLDTALAAARPVRPERRRETVGVTLP